MTFRASKTCLTPSSFFFFFFFFFSTDRSKAVSLLQFFVFASVVSCMAFVLLFF